MGRTLNLLDHLLMRARHLIAMEQFRDTIVALRRFGKLASLPAATAAEVHHLLGEANLKLGQYRLARRHLRESLRLVPANAPANHMLARAFESDPQADAARASGAYRRALAIAPCDPRLLADAGAYLAQMGREKKGLALLAQARELAPDDLGLIRSQVETLCELERFDEALTTVNVAAFRLRREPRLAQMREQIEFRQVRLAQRRASREVAAAAIDSPVLLPFLGVVGERSPRTGTHYRRDVITKIRPHLRPTPDRVDTGRSG